MCFLVFGFDFVGPIVTGILQRGEGGKGGKRNEKSKGEEKGTLLTNKNKKKKNKKPHHGSYGGEFEGRAKQQEKKLMGI